MMKKNSSKSNYKKTILGLIPSHWEVGKVGDVCEVINGRGFKPHEWKKEGYPIIRIQNLNGGEEYNYYEGEFDPKILVEKGQLLFAWSGSKGTSFGPHIWKGTTGLLNYHTWKINVDSKKIDKEFLLHYLRIITTRIEERAHGASALVHTQKGEMESFPILLPPMSEQRKIAKILSTWDAAIETLEKLIKEKEKRKKAIMQKLLTGKVRFKEFRKEKWGSIELKECVSHFIVPMRDKPKDLTGSVPWCRIEDFDGKYLAHSKSNQGVSLQTIKEMKLKVYPAGTLLVSCSANLGVCAITTKELVTNQTFIGLVPRQQNVEFLYHVMMFNAKELNKLSSGTTISYLSREEFENFRIRVPKSINEQNKISRFLSVIDDEIFLIKREMESILQSKKGLMQKLLNGKVRVKV